MRSFLSDRIVDLLAEQKNGIFSITLNRVHKHNAFDDALLIDLQKKLEQAIADSACRVIILAANGTHFSAGADLAWMQKMVNFTEEENWRDALILAQVLSLLYKSPKPTIAVVQGAALGGGAGLAVACDITIAAKSAYFGFPEVKLGLIPAVISPYVIKAIGERAAKWLFMSAEIIAASQAQQLNLVQYCVEDNKLLDFSLNYAQKMTRLAPQAVSQSKKLVEDFSHLAISENVLEHTATLIAKKRISAEGQEGLKAFLNKTKPSWN